MKQELLPENKYMLNIFSVTFGNRWMIHREKFEEYIETNYFFGRSSR